MKLSIIIFGSLGFLILIKMLFFTLSIAVG